MNRSDLEFRTTVIKPDTFDTFLIGGFGIATLAGLAFEDKKSIAIETGIQNSGLGLLLIFNFFDGLGGMALTAAWWAIWHIVMGFTMGWYWSVGKRSIIKVFSNA